MELYILEVVHRLYILTSHWTLQCRYDWRGVCLSRCFLSQPSFTPSIHPSVCPLVACKLDNLDSQHQRCPQFNRNMKECCCYCCDYCYWPFIVDYSQLRYIWNLSIDSGWGGALLCGSAVCVITVQWENTGGGGAKHDNQLAHPSTPVNLLIRGLYQEVNPPPAGCLWPSLGTRAPWGHTAAHQLTPFPNRVQRWLSSRYRPLSRRGSVSSLSLQRSPFSLGTRVSGSLVFECVVKLICK